MGFVSIPPDYGAIMLVRAAWRTRRARLMRRPIFPKSPSDRHGPPAGCHRLWLWAVVQPRWGEASDESAREDARPTEMPNRSATRHWLRLLFGLKRYNNRLWAWRFSITAQT